MKWYSDFVFWDRVKGNILATESLQEGNEMGYAQTLAQRHGVTVAYGVVADYFVEPMRCPNCKEVLPESGPCPCSVFEEEEQAIPFQGEPMFNREVSIRDFYGV